MTHTPGPWTTHGPSPGHQIRNMDDGGDYAIINDGKIIAEAFHRVGETRYEDAKANARLIAAAPNLLEACEIGLQIAKWTAQVRNAPKALAKDIETIEAAIAKAKKE